MVNLEVKMKNFIMAAFLTLAAFFIFAADLTAAPAGGTKANEQLFRAIYPAAPKSLDPHATPDPNAWPIIMTAYNRLMTFEPGSAKPVPALARRVIVAPTGLVYTFVLREGYTFSDGTVVNSEAALFTFDRLMSSEVGQLYYPHLYRLEVVGPYTFRLFLKRPWPPFLASLALPQASLISPGLRNKPPEYLNDHTLGSGQYVVYDWQEQTLGLQTRPDLVSRPPIAFAMFHYEPDPQQRYEKMIQHSAHLTIDPALPANKPLPVKYQVKKAPSFNARYVAFNTRRTYTKMQNTRRALSFIINDAFKDRPGHMKDPFPTGLFYNAPRRFNAAAPAVGGTDPVAQGRLIINEVGPPAGPLTLVYKAGDALLAADARLIRDTLAPYGIILDVVSLEGALGRQIVETGDFDLYLDTRRADIPSADMWLGRFMDGTSSIGGNPAFFNDEKAARLVQEISNLAGQPDDGPNDLLRVENERAVMVAELAEIAMIEAPYVFLYQLETTLVMDEMVKLWVNKKIEDGLTHPMWPDIWPIDQTILKAVDFRSGANPTGKRPETQSTDNQAGGAASAKMPSIQSVLGSLPSQAEKGMSMPVSPIPSKEKKETRIIQEDLAPPPLSTFSGEQAQ
ncbi:hypothetical protein C4J81_10600 [Deltaproteobacteria bacterium Smac51]|nr:hypothetical protein C4J81_10600 [Deltaproteobacteria bacterium Smac51]